MLQNQLQARVQLFRLESSPGQAPRAHVGRAAHENTQIVAQPEILDEHRARLQLERVDLALEQRETFSDHRHLIIYGQRTGDGRLVFGGRGAPYHLGSRIRPDYDLDVMSDDQSPTDVKKNTW